jgi:hypothetical protein
MGQFTLWEMKVPRMKENGRKTKWPFDMWGKKSLTLLSFGQ